VAVNSTSATVPEARVVYQRMGLLAASISVHRFPGRTPIRRGPAADFDDLAVAAHEAGSQSSLGDLEEGVLAPDDAAVAAVLASTQVRAATVTRRHSGSAGHPVDGSTM